MKLSGSAPLTAVQLLWVNMIMDTLGALALATEPPNEGLMKRPPVGRGVNFITRTMWRNIIGQSIYQLAILAVLTFDGKRILKLSGSNATLVLNTFIFNTFVFCQVWIKVLASLKFDINSVRLVHKICFFPVSVLVLTGIQRNKQSGNGEDKCFPWDVR